MQLASLGVEYRSDMGQLGEQFCSYHAATGTSLIKQVNLHHFYRQLL
jgi:hypothetical protein